MDLRKLSALGYDVLVKMGNIEQRTTCAKTGTKVFDTIYNGSVFRKVYFGENTRMFKKGIKYTKATFERGQIDKIDFCNGDSFNYKLGTGSEFLGDALTYLKPKNVLKNILENGRMRI